MEISKLRSAYYNNASAMAPKTTTGNKRRKDPTTHPIPPNHPFSPGYPGKGFQLNDYLIEETLGHGSMATVFLAHDPTGHDVAIKIFQEGPGVSATMLERFRREADTSKKLRRHPNIMRVYATGQEGPYHYIVMESIKRSKTLEDALESSSLSQPAIVRLIIKIARALQYAHAHRIVHRDVKPSNIMMDEFGEPLLSDFGVAELIDLPSCTLTGALTGTPLYMSPEQARGERVGPASDIYSLGVVLFEALTGVLPYHVEHFSPVKEVIEAVKNEEPRRPRLFRKEITPDLEAVILKSIEKEPKDRYADAEAFAVDLERALAGRRVSAQRFSPLDHIRHLLRRHRRVLPFLLGLLLLGVGAGTLFRNQLLKEREQGLLRKAQLRNLEYLLDQASTEAPRSTQPPRAWQEIRIARRAMTSGNWSEAAASFASAAEFSREVGDQRTAAIAELDQARCEALQNRFPAARALYQAILQNPDAPPSITGAVHLEYLELALLENQQTEAVDWLKTHKLPVEPAFRDAILCLGGELKPEIFVESINRLAPRLQNDAFLAAAIRFHLEGDTRRAQSVLRQCLQSSSPPSEWPAPLARLLFNRFTVD